MYSLKNNNFLLTTDEMTWYKDKSIAEISGDIYSSINQMTFLSKSARYHHNKDIVEFYGVQEFKYIDKSSNSVINVKADRATWYGKNKRLKFTSTKSQVRTSLSILDILN